MENSINSIHLVGRHPEIVQSEQFKKWHASNGSNLWHETHPDTNGNFTVIVQSKDETTLIGFRLNRDPNNVDPNSLGSRITDVRTYDLIKERVNKFAVLAEIEKVVNRKDVIAIRPKIDWDKTENSLGWEVDVTHEGKLRSFLLGPDLKLSAQEEREFKKNSADAKQELLSNDWLEENELHHLNRYRALALQWAGNAATPSDKAFRIFLKTRQAMVYDANVRHIAEFVWADNLVIDHLGYRGICDEWAVIQITMLRALGIPSNMKFLTFRYNGQNTAHACLEWLDNGQWRHMDALWSAFDFKSVYRRNGCTNVAVMDASFPRDNRYNGNAWGVPDVRGDGKLHPYGDYIINPNYPGSMRSGYSH